MGITCKSSLYYCKTYPYCFGAFVLAALGCVALTVSVSSPLWLVSKPDSGSDFVRLGLWSICFKRYHHPALSHVLDGCYPLHRLKYEEMKKWLQPAWFTIVQCLITSAVFLSALCVCILGYMAFQVELEIKLFIAAFVLVFEVICAFMVITGVWIFCYMSLERTWIKHSASNTLSWGFGFSIAAAIFTLLAAGCLSKQTLKLREVLARDNTSYHIPLSNRSMPY